MKNLLSFAIFAILFLGLGALALSAAPGGLDFLPSSAPPETVAQAAAPEVAENWNEIAMPLDGTSAIANAQAIADVITGTQQLLHWDPAAQNFEFFIPDPVATGGSGTDFLTALGGAYFVKVDNTAPMVFSVVGDVPPQTGNPGALQYNMVGASPTCKWNHITLPLDQSSITGAQGLADSIGVGVVQQMLHWDATTQNFEFYIPHPVATDGSGTPFSTNIGYPYLVCLSTNTIWP